MARKPVSKRKIFHKYRLVFFNDKTFEEVWHLRVNAFTLLSVAGTLCLLLIFGSMALVMFTPMRELVPGYFSEKTKRQLMETVMRLDSVENEIVLRDKYLYALQNTLLGKDSVTTDTLAMQTVGHEQPDLNLSEQEAQLRREVEEAEKFNFALSNAPRPEGSISNVHFFIPVKGIISAKFDPALKHLGIDLVTQPDAVVVATLEGTVILAEWTLSTGYVMHIQHPDNLVSAYKHNANLLRKAGDKVKAGEAIAIVGNSGEITTGPHLHFELWYNGHAVNPEEYILF